MYLTNPGSSRVGGLAVAVPGELKGLEYAWRHVHIQSQNEFHFQRKCPVRS
jgi:hypothetical protein